MERWVIKYGNYPNTSCPYWVPFPACGTKSMYIFMRKYVYINILSWHHLWLTWYIRTQMSFRWSKLSASGLQEHKALEKDDGFHTPERLAREMSHVTMWLNHEGNQYPKPSSVGQNRRYNYQQNWQKARPRYTRWLRDISTMGYSNP